MWLFIQGFRAGTFSPNIRAQKYCETHSIYEETLHRLVRNFESKCDVCYAYYGTQRTEHLSARWFCRGCSAKRNLCYEMNQYCDTCALPFLSIRRKLRSMTKARSANTRMKHLHDVYTLLHAHFYHIFKTSGLFVLQSACHKTLNLDKQLMQSQLKHWSVYRTNKLKAALRSYRRLFLKFITRLHVMFVRFFPLDVVRSILTFL